MSAKKKTTTKYGGGGTPGTEYVINKHKKDGSLKKHKSISKNRFDRVSNRYAKQDGSKSLGTSTSRGEQVISGRNSNNSVSRSNPMQYFREGFETRKAAAIENLTQAQTGLPEMGMHTYGAPHLPSKKMLKTYKKYDKKSQREEAKDKRVMKRSNNQYSKSLELRKKGKVKRADRLRDKSKIVLLNNRIISG